MFECRYHAWRGGTKCLRCGLTKEQAEKLRFEKWLKNTEGVNKMQNKKVHIFGKYGEWAISLDDGCLQLHPQWKSHPEKTAKHIWREAYEEIISMGGFEATISKLTKGEGGE